MSRRSKRRRQRRAQGLPNRRTKAAPQSQRRRQESEWTQLVSDPFHVDVATLAAQSGYTVPEVEAALDELCEAGWFWCPEPGWYMLAIPEGVES